MNKDELVTVGTSRSGCKEESGGLNHDTICSSVSSSRCMIIILRLASVYIALKELKIAYREFQDGIDVKNILDQKDVDFGIIKIG